MIAAGEITEHSARIVMCHTILHMLFFSVAAEHMSNRALRRRRHHALE